MRGRNRLDWSDLSRLAKKQGAKNDQAAVLQGSEEAAVSMPFLIGMDQLAKAVQIVETTVASLSTGTPTAGSGNNEVLWLDKSPLAQAAKQLPATGQATVQAKVKGVGLDGTSYYTGELVASFYRPYKGAGVQLGATQAKHPEIRSGVGIFALFGIDAQSRVYLTVNDSGVSAMHWMAWIEFRRTTYQMAGSASVLIQNQKPFIR